MSSEIPIRVDTVPTPNPNAIMLRVQETLVASGTHEYTPDDAEVGNLAAGARQSVNRLGRQGRQAAAATSFCHRWLRSRVELRQLREFWS